MEQRAGPRSHPGAGALTWVTSCWLGTAATPGPAHALPNGPGQGGLRSNPESPGSSPLPLSEDQSPRSPGHPLLRLAESSRSSLCSPRPAAAPPPRMDCPGLAASLAGHPRPELVTSQAGERAATSTGHRRCWRVSGCGWSSAVSTLDFRQGPRAGRAGSSAGGRVGAPLQSFRWPWPRPGRVPVSVPGGCRPDLSGVLCASKETHTAGSRVFLTSTSMLFC